MNKPDLLKQQRNYYFQKGHTINKGKKQSKEHIKKRIENSKKTFKKNHPKIKTNCNYCNKIFFYVPSKFKKGKLHFCNKKCMGKFMSKNPKLYYTSKRNKNLSNSLKGRKFSNVTKKKMSLAKKDKYFKKNNPNWKGGISNQSKYNFEFTNELKEKIRKRDNQICQLCKRKSKKAKLPIHHIDFNKKNNNPNNLITLCHNCHKNIHHKK